jgi:hypothetical protein
MTAGEITSTDSAPAQSVRPVRPHAFNPDLFRFVCSTFIGACVGGVLFIWDLWDLFSGHVSPLRFEPNGNFYDAQARAIEHGHLYVPKAVLQIEGFKHAGHYYTYFGILPSLFRIPILFVDPGIAGRLTAPSILVAWAIAALVSAMLMWRVRVLVRGTPPLGDAEATSYAVLMAVITGGSTLLFLASIPWVYNEDLAWSIAATLGSLFALLGILERPSWGRVAAAGVFVFAANLDRLPTGWACAVGAVLVALWLALGRSGIDHKHFAVPVLAVAAVSLAAGCIINWLKFGVVFGLPFESQVWTGLNAHRREFLRLSDRKGYGIQFFPTDFWTYFQPFGIRLQTVFPYITLPATTPKILAGAFFDATYRTASVPASMPLLFLLTCWGVVASFLRAASDKAKLLRIPLIAAAGAFGVDLVWGYIAPRFEADVLPLLILGSATGTAYIWRRIDGRAQRAATIGQSQRATRRVLRSVVAKRKLVVTVFVVLGIYGLVANFGIAAPPTVVAYSNSQARGYVTTQEDLSNLTGNPLASYVMAGSRIPYYEPAGKLFILNNCSATDGGLYVSTGETFKYNPQQQEEHNTWIPVDRGMQVEHLFEYTFNGPLGAQSGPVPMVSVGADTIFIETSKEKGHLEFGISGPGFATSYGPFPKVELGHSYGVAIDTDPALHVFTIVTFAVGGHFSIESALPSGGSVAVHSFLGTKGTTPPPITTLSTGSPRANMQLCNSVRVDLPPHEASATRNGAR